MHSLEVRGLYKSYGKKVVLRNIDLSVSTSEIVGLLGPNGAGKTTTFYSILGLIRPEKGTIHLDHEDISVLPMYQRALRGISYLPQEPSIFRKLSVEDNLKAVLEIKGLSKDEIEAELHVLLKEFNLEEFSKRDGFKLSGGERRRTEIARALATEPSFILLDEPFAGIDPIAVIELQKIIRQLKEQGIGVLITDHNVRETLGICDLSYLLKDGQVQEKGTAEQLVNSPLARETYLGENFRL